MSHATRTATAPVLTTAPTLDVRVILDAVIRTHRPLLLQTARDLLRSRRHRADDVVQDVCLAVLEGAIELSVDPRTALLDMLRAVAAEAMRGSTK